MKKLLLSMAVLALIAMTGTAMANGKGLKVGKNPELLAATKCSNAGRGNLGEFIDEEGCVKKTGGENDEDEPDPGNSGDHNNVQQ